MTHERKGWNSTVKLTINRSFFPKAGSSLPSAGIPPGRYSSAMAQAKAEKDLGFFPMLLYTYKRKKGVKDAGV